MASNNFPAESTAIDDIEALWKQAVDKFQQRTHTRMTDLATVSTLDELLAVVQSKEKQFKHYRHDGTRLDKFRTFLGKSLKPVEQLLNSLSNSVSVVFPASSAIFTGLFFLISTANTVSGDYDKLTEFFEDLGLYLSRLKILQTRILPCPELALVVTEILTSVLDLCAVCAMYMKTNRVVKAFRNLVLDGDEELSDCLKHFQKMVVQEEGLVRNLSLVKLHQIQEENVIIAKGVQDVLTVNRNVEASTESLRIDFETLNTGLEERQSNSQRKHVLARLTQLDFHKKQRDVFARRSEGTSHWLLEKSCFKDWTQLPDARVLWCPGPPGAGKTVMTSVVADHIQQLIEGSNSTLAYIYCDYKESYTECDILSSIAKQLAEQVQPLPSVVIDFCEKDAERRRHPSGDEWISLICSLCTAFEKNYILIDALDECSEFYRDELLRLLRNLEPHARFFITSRAYVDVRRFYPTALRIDISASNADVRTYLENEISRNRRLSILLAKEQSLREEIVRTITTKATGMFLLVTLQIDELCRQTNLKKLRESMKQLPSDLETYFQNAFSRIEARTNNDRQLAKKALSYIFCAKRPLTLLELQHVLSVEFGDTRLDASKFDDPEVIEEVCTGLIRIDESSGSVGLVHNTLQEYLERHQEHFIVEYEVEFTKACLTYLSYEDFGSGSCTNNERLEERLQEYRFVHYASLNCGVHFSKNQQHSELLKLLFTFLGDNRKLASCVQVLYVPEHKSKDWYDRFPKHFGALHMAAYWGLKEIIDALLKEHVEINSKDSYGMSALHLTAACGHQSSADVLLAKGAALNLQNNRGETPLILACKHGHQSVVKVLLDSRVDVFITDQEGWPAFDWAVVGGHSQIVKTLQDHLNPTTTFPYMSARALYLAADEGHHEILQLLVDGGFDVNAQDYLGSSALDFAAPPGRISAVRTLLRNGASVNSRDYYGNSVMHWAIRHPAILQLLLDAGADVEASNHLGQTPLLWVAQEGLLESAIFLVEQNADINVQDIYGFSPLHRAALRDQVSMVKFLLTKGADPNTKDKLGWTALHIATIKEYDDIVQILLSVTTQGHLILTWATSVTKDSMNKAFFGEVLENKAEASTVVTGLRLAIQEGQLSRALDLLAKGADINAMDAVAGTALLMAAWRRNFEAVKMLLENGANVNLCGLDRLTPLHFAARSGEIAILQLLLAYGANANADAFSWTAALLAAERGDSEMVAFLVENGASVDGTDYHGRSLLHWAAKFGDLRTIRILSDQKVDLNTHDRWGRTPLMWAVENDQEAVVDLLLSLGADASRKSNHGITTLHVAAFCGLELMAKRILRTTVDTEAEAIWRDDASVRAYDAGIRGTVHQNLSDFLNQKMQETVDRACLPKQVRQGLTACQLARELGYFRVVDILNPSGKEVNE